MKTSLSLFAPPHQASKPIPHVPIPLSSPIPSLPRRSHPFPLLRETAYLSLDPPCYLPFRGLRLAAWLSFTLQPIPTPKCSFGSRLPHSGWFFSNSVCLPLFNITLRITRVKVLRGPSHTHTNDCTQKSLAACKSAYRVPVPRAAVSLIATQWFLTGKHWGVDVIGTQCLMSARAGPCAQTMPFCHWENHFQRTDSHMRGETCLWFLHILQADVPNPLL